MIGVKRMGAPLVTLIIALAGCTSSHHQTAGAEHLPGAKASPSTPASSGPLVVVESHVDTHHVLGAPRILRSDQVRFTTGGSSTCPPVVRSAKRRGDTLVLNVEPANTSCTLDLKFYGVVTTLNQRVFDDPTLRFVVYGYGGHGRRIALTRSA